MRRLILHIGLEKTGTTSFQAFCTQNRARLAALGVVYPVAPDCFLEINHAPLAASYFSAADAARLLIAGRRADRARAIAALDAEVGEAPLTLLSAEHFSSRFDPTRIAALGADLSSFEVSVAMVVRDPAARAISAYATTVASGRDISLDAFVDELCSPANPYLRARATIETWARVFGLERMIVAPLREGDDIVPTLGACLMPGWPAEGGIWRNAAPSAQEIERRHATNAMGAAGRLAERLTHVLRQTPDFEQPALSPCQSRRIAAATADDLTWLQQQYGIAFG